MKNLICFCIILLTSTSCGIGTSATTSDPGDNGAVKTFLNKFNKEDFILKIEKQRDFYENVVRDLKNENKVTDDLKLKYTDTQRAYNNVLDGMTKDIMAVQSVLGFQFFDTEARYGRAFDEAAKVGAVFTNAAMKALNKEHDSIGIISFVVSKIFPIIKNVEKIYLSYVQNKMVERMSRAEFRFWEDINLKGK